MSEVPDPAVLGNLVDEFQAAESTPVKQTRNSALEPTPFQAGSPFSPSKRDVVEARKQHQYEVEIDNLELKIHQMQQSVRDLKAKNLTLKQRNDELESRDTLSRKQLETVNHKAAELDRKLRGKRNKKVTDTPRHKAGVPDAPDSPQDHDDGSSPIDVVTSSTAIPQKRIIHTDASKIDLLNTTNAGKSTPLVVQPMPSTVRTFPARNLGDTAILDNVTVEREYIGQKKFGVELLEKCVRLEMDFVARVDRVQQLQRQTFEEANRWRITAKYGRKLLWRLWKLRMRRVLPVEVWRELVPHLEAIVPTKSWQSTWAAGDHINSGCEKIADEPNMQQFPVTFNERLLIPRSYHQSVPQVFWSHCQAHFVTVGTNGRIHVLSRDGSIVAQDQLPVKQLRALRWSPNDSGFACASANDDKIIFFSLQTATFGQIELTAELPQPPSAKKQAARGHQRHIVESFEFVRDSEQSVIIVFTEAGHILSVDLLASSRQKVLDGRIRAGALIDCQQDDTVEAGYIAIAHASQRVLLLSPDGHLRHERHLPEVPLSCCWIDPPPDMLADGQDPAQLQAPLVVLLRGNAIVLFKVKDDRLSKPKEIVFRTDWGAIVKIEPLSSGYLLVAFERGFVEIVSTDKANLGHVWMSMRLHGVGSVRDAVCDRVRHRTVVVGSTGLAVLDMLAGDTDDSHVALPTIARFDLDKLSYLSPKPHDPWIEYIRMQQFASRANQFDVVSVEVIGCHGLHSQQAHLGHVFVEIDVDGTRHQTSVVQLSDAVFWNQQFFFLVPAVFDEDETEQLDAAKVEYARQWRQGNMRSLCGSGSDSTYSFEVDLLEARGLRQLDRFGKSDPFCIARFTNQTFKSRAKKRTLEPMWNETAKFEFVPALQQFLYFELWDHDSQSQNGNNLVGLAQFKLTTVDPLCVDPVWIDINDSTGEHVGRLKFKLDFHSWGTEEWSFTVHVLRAEDLKMLDFSGNSDPYVHVSYAGIRHTTKVIPANLNPVWNESFQFAHSEDRRQLLHIEVADRDLHDHAGHHGAVEIDLRTVGKDTKHATPRWYPITNPETGEPAGEVQLAIRCSAKRSKWGKDSISFLKGVGPTTRPKRYEPQQITPLAKTISERGTVKIKLLETTYNQNGWHQIGAFQLARRDIPACGPASNNACATPECPTPRPEDQTHQRAMQGTWELRCEGRVRPKLDLRLKRAKVRTSSMLDDVRALCRKPQPLSVEQLAQLGLSPETILGTKPPHIQARQVIQTQWLDDGAAVSLSTNDGSVYLMDVEECGLDMTSMLDLLHNDSIADSAHALHSDDHDDDDQASDTDSLGSI